MVTQRRKIGFLMLLAGVFLAMAGFGQDKVLLHVWAPRAHEPAVAQGICRV